MDVNGIEPKETIPASRKLGKDEALKLLRKATRLVVSKGKRVNVFAAPKALDEGAVVAMLGPTGNMRAPTVKVGKTLLVGFNEEHFAETLLQ